MKIEVEYDLIRDEVVLHTPFSHRAFSVKRQFCCRECSTVNRNPLVEVLRAVAVYTASEKREVEKAVLAYDLEEILRRMEGGPEIKRVHEGRRGHIREDGVEVRTIPRMVSFDELGELE